MSHYQYLHSFWIRWYQSQGFGVFGDVLRRLFLGNGIDQILVFMLKYRLLPVQILQLLVCRDCLAKLRQVENSHETDQEYATDAQRHGPHGEEKWVKLSAASCGL